MSSFTLRGFLDLCFSSDVLEWKERGAIAQWIKKTTAACFLLLHLPRLTCRIVVSSSGAPYYKSKPSRIFCLQIVLHSVPFANDYPWGLVFFYNPRTGCEIISVNPDYSAPTTEKRKNLKSTNAELEITFQRVAFEESSRKNLLCKP